MSVKKVIFCLQKNRRVNCKRIVASQPTTAKHIHIHWKGHPSRGLRAPSKWTFFACTTPKWWTKWLHHFLTMFFQNFLCFGSDDRHLRYVAIQPSISPLSSIQLFNPLSSVALMTPSLLLVAIRLYALSGWSVSLPFPLLNHFFIICTWQCHPYPFSFGRFHQSLRKRREFFFVFQFFGQSASSCIASLVDHSILYMYNNESICPSITYSKVYFSNSVSLTFFF